MLFRHGLNAKQVQGWLGHRAASFTIDTYIHLLDDDLPEAGFLDGLTAIGETAPLQVEEHEQPDMLERVADGA